MASQASDETHINIPVDKIITHKVGYRGKQLILADCMQFPRILGTASAFRSTKRPNCNADN